MAKAAMRKQWQPLKRGGVAAVVSFFFFFFFFLIVGIAVYAAWIHLPVDSVRSYEKTSTILTRRAEKVDSRLECIAWNQTPTCPRYHASTAHPINPSRPPNSTCPDYFRWIHEDLRAWKGTGITRDMVERAGKTAHFRLVIVGGRVYVERYKRSLQTRDLFTLWGIVQLARWYPGRLPDLELMFDCDDRPAIRSKDYRRPNSGPPPLFRYCGDAWSLDIVFPDWSFWGWAETNIKPWESVLKDIKQANKRSKWEERVPLAYWRGNPNVAPTRADLMKCNLTAKDDWNTRLYVQNWEEESKQGYKQSHLEDQCTHRYKIYVEGWAWSVSEKYILACDSTTLLITPHFHDFFTRGMLPLHHYWPIRDTSKCKSLKFAVEWGNNHTAEARALGEAARNYIHEDVKMENVYDYMFHLLNEYAKLLKFKPTIPSMGMELCPERMACGATDNWERFMMESLVESPADAAPCDMPPPYDSPAFKAFLDEKLRATKQVETWENEHWDEQTKKQ